MMKLIKCICVVSLFNLILLTPATNEGQYECGLHGRFEYCIDGIPTCVIGCHCHPGYYFDTDSKICEPNTKLTQNFRRNLPEPTRASLDMAPLASNPTPTTINVLDEDVEAIANDADDLSDWLYNHFFKTIENQVINNTKKEQLSRRSASMPPIQETKLKRKSRKSVKKPNRNKFSKKSLCKKFLQITEDDTLIDSGSGSSDGSSSETASSSSDSHSDDTEHVHRKIIMINKKSTPLPSFIFLPNIDTPFYPPIGLPPPPIPMYPMVPVPPMLSMYPGTTCEDRTSATPSTDSSTSSTTTASTIITTSRTTKEVTKEAVDEAPNDPPITGSKRYLQKVNKYNQRSEFPQKLRNKMKKHYEKLPDKRVVNTQLNHQDLHSVDDNVIEEPLFDNEFQTRDPEQMKLNDVNFKYLSQLIHRENSNKTENRPKIPNNTIERQRDFKINGNNYNSALDLRNQQTQKFGHQNNLSNIEEPDNSYYANLGKQIASLVRKIDSIGAHEIDIEIEHTQENQNYQPIFNENLFAPRSFWERSIRSPLKNFHVNNHNINFFLGSSEKLISLEEQVNSAATTKPTLNLHQLENIISLMNRQQPPIKRKQVNWKLTKTPSRNLKINLLPVKNIRSNTVAHVSKPLDFSKNYPNDFYTKPQNYDTFKDFNKEKLYDTPLRIKSNNINKSLDIEPQKTSNSINLGHVQKLSETPKQNIWQKANVLPPRPQMKLLNSNIHNPVVISYKNNRPFSSDQVVKPQSYFYHNVHHFDYFV